MSEMTNIEVRIGSFGAKYQLWLTDADRRYDGFGTIHLRDVGEATGDFEQVRLAGGAVVGDRRLDQVPGAIELVRADQLGPPLVEAAKDVEGVEIPVRLLRRGHLGDDPVDELA